MEVISHNDKESSIEDSQIETAGDGADSTSKMVAVDRQIEPTNSNTGEPASHETLGITPDAPQRPETTGLADRSFSSSNRPNRDVQDDTGEPKDVKRSDHPFESSRTERDHLGPIENGPSSAPWLNSPALGGYYVYLPSTDEIYLHDGRRYARPQRVPRSALASATYNGSLPPPPRLSQHPSATNLVPSRENLLMDQLSSARGQANSTALHPEHVTANKPVEIFFPEGRSPSQIQRKDPPNINSRGSVVDKPDLVGTLFKSYKIRDKPKDFFRVGKVFMVLWSEPAGGSSVVSKWAAGTVINHLGERVFSKVRRFVLIREGGSYCNALPINTYTGRGVAKHGINKSEHVIIYTGSAPPRPTPQEMPRPGEAGMRPVPIQVDPVSRDEILDPMSRLDLGGVTRVEHNIKVKALGNVNARFLDALRTQYVNVQTQQAGIGPSAVPSHYALHANQPQQASESDDDDDDDDNDDQSEDDDEEEIDDDEEQDDDDEEDQANSSRVENNIDSDDDGANNTETK